MQEQRLRQQIEQVLAEIDNLPLLACEQREQLELLLVALEQELTTGVPGGSYSMLEQLEMIGVELESEHPTLALVVRNMTRTMNAIGV
ncbi:uncharacterized protein DUF4404 [Sinobacterium caligoides]|uniref:Uncharacterized protein DUF4404 n=1 Tax=Sinobacterium caligoides TaxID=933926 RepID=A0A3N2DFQ6_9GAMM|nr:DUF4404 family protein [Sinobacterium caligoides]ROR98622.1 uncharacterized protein DUF4404 [Sinobacterium caligoides]